MTPRTCHVCGNPIDTFRAAFTAAGQCVYLGSNCHKRVARTGDVGWLPPTGGPRLFLRARKNAA